MNNFWKYTHTRAIWDVDEFVFSSDLEKRSIASLANQWILCSEWVPSKWESKHPINKHHNNPQVNPHHSSPSINILKRKAAFITKRKSVIKMFLTWNHCLESSIHYIDFSSESGEKYSMHRSSIVYKQKQSKTDLNKYADWFWCERTTGDGLFHWRRP